MSEFYVKMPYKDMEKWFGTLNKEYKSMFKMIVLNTLLKAEKLAKKFAPVDNGDLMRGIHSYPLKSKLAGVIYAWINYSPYQEFGTGNKVFTQHGLSYVPDKDVKDYASQFKGAGKRKVNMGAQPYFFPAINLAKKEMIARLNQIGFKKTK